MQRPFLKYIVSKSNDVLVLEPERFQNKKTHLGSTALYGMSISLCHSLIKKMLQSPQTEPGLRAGQSRAICSEPAAGLSQRNGVICKMCSSSSLPFLHRKTAVPPTQLPELKTLHLRNLHLLRVNRQWGIQTMDACIDISHRTL